ncbi:unnamed protein product [Lymnaea stagnalis]|uniref:Uncharacterized protein n=1 Tax=Lymnaea stagnalis TaxID=6523 RepID=A0AAV2GZZ2_LYMST
MFKNKTAWFSKTCLVDSASIWAQNGGTIVNMDLAQFIFSDDWTHEDTKDISNSEAYLKEHLAVFRSQYVLDAVNNGSEKCTLGTYFLYPPDILEKIKKREPSTNVDAPSKYASDNEVSVQGQMNKRTHNGKKTSCSPNLEPKQKISKIAPQLSHSSKSTNSEEAKRGTNTKAGTLSSTPRNQIRNLLLSHDAIKDIESIPDVKTLPKVTDELEFIDLDDNDVKMILKSS